MKVFVAGGAGYIGSILIPELLAEGYSLKCLDASYFGDKFLRGLGPHPGLEVLKGDTRSFDPSALNGASAVIDLAAISQPDPMDQLGLTIFEDINLRGALRLASLAKRYGVERYVFASTCSVYGFQGGILSERSPLNPIENYGRTKAEAERAILGLSGDGFSVTALRFATVYGLSPKMRFDLVVNGMTLSLFKAGRIRVMRDGTQWRPNVHVRDVAKAILAVLEADVERVRGEVFNVGSNDQNFQVYQLAKLIGDSVGEPYEIEWYGEPDTRSYRVDFSKIAEVLGFKARYTPAEGAREIYEGLKDGIISDCEEAYVIKWYKRLLESGLMAERLIRSGTP
jgi:nucleoside-diphosphate-sugar epimerase